MSFFIQELRPSPFEMEPWQNPIPARKERVGEFEINFIENGLGSTLIFIHGLAANLNVWNYSFFEFSQNYHCIALDLPGYGNSTILNTQYSFDLFAKSIVGLMDKLGIEKATMIGNSMGGHTAAYLRINYPERVERLVLVDPSGTLVFPLHLRIATLYPELTASLVYKFFVKRTLSSPPERVLKNLQEIANRFKILKRFFFHNPDSSPAKEFTEFILTHLALLISKGQMYEFLWMLTRPAKMIHQTNLTKHLNKIKSPTLLVWGDDDWQVPIKFAKIFHQNIPGSKFVLIKDCGHCPMIEKPNEFNTAVKEFLQTSNKIC